MRYNPLSLISWLIGRGGGPAFAGALDTTTDRANVRFIVPDDSRLYIRRWTRKNLVDKAEWLWQNFGIVKEGIAGIARHTVGKGINLQVNSEDDEWNRLAEEAFENYATTPTRVDLAGRRNFYEAQTLAVEHRLLRGEFFAALTENPDWKEEPCFHVYDSEEIISPPTPPGNTMVVDAPSLSVTWPAPDSKAANDTIIFDGVEIDANNRAVGYWVRTVAFEAERVDRSQMVHWFKPHATNQIRGVTDLAQAVNPLVDIHELVKLTTRTAKAHQLIALVLKGVAKSKTRGAMGAIRQAGDDQSGSASGAPDTSQLEKLAGAAGAGIAYLNSEGEAQLITPTSPTPLVEGFITDLLMRDVCAGWGVPSEFFWNINKLGGANTRFILSKADLFFQVLADGLINHFCNPVAYRFLQFRMQQGLLRPCKDKNWALKLAWQTPPRVTVDNGNDGNQQIEFLANGMTNLRDWSAARGQNYRHQMRQWIQEPIEFLAAAKEELAASNLTPDQQKTILDRWAANIPLWRAAKPGAAAPNPNQQQAKPAPPQPEENAA